MTNLGMIQNSTTVLQSTCVYLSCGSPISVVACVAVHAIQMEAGARRGGCALSYVLDPFHKELYDNHREKKPNHTAGNRNGNTASTSSAEAAASSSSAYQTATTGGAASAAAMNNASTAPSAGGGTVTVSQIPQLPGSSETTNPDQPVNAHVQQIQSTVHAAQLMANAAAAFMQQQQQLSTVNFPYTYKCGLCMAKLCLYPSLA